MTYTEVTGRQYQSIVEMALLEFGSIDGIPYIMEDNPDMNFIMAPMQPLTGETLLIRNDAVINKRMREELRKKYPNIGNWYNFLVPGILNELPEPLDDFDGLVKYTEYEQ